MAKTRPSEETYVITLLGDLMLGRLIDQMLPQHVDEPDEAGHAAHFKTSNPGLRNYDHAAPWGNSLPLLQQSDLVLGNLETSATVTNNKWPNKVFNYRMHPANTQCLKTAGVDYVSLANNHTLDFNAQGLFDTVQALKEAGVAFAGAGETVEEAERPAVLCLPQQGSNDSRTEGHEIHLYSYSDHPTDWSVIPQFNLLTYNAASKVKLKSAVTKSYPGLSPQPVLKIVSIHWGPNYSWHPDDEIIDMAHFLIEECGIDIIHGHSSHHIQGVEIYKGKLIIYGCGDFVDDYAVNPGYRNDLSAAWNIKFGLSSVGEKASIQRLEVHPNRITKFQAHILDPGDIDYGWVKQKFVTLCSAFGTEVGDRDGRITVSFNNA